MLRILISMKHFHLSIILMWLLCIQISFSQIDSSQLLLLMIKLVQDVCLISHKIDARDSFSGNGEAVLFL